MSFRIGLIRAEPLGFNRKGRIPFKFNIPLKQTGKVATGNKQLLKTRRQLSDRYLASFGVVCVPNYSLHPNYRGPLCLYNILTITYRYRGLLDAI